MKRFSTIYDELADYADAMIVIDTHEHLHPHKNHIGEAPDVLCDYFSHYITTDLCSAGMSADDLSRVRDVSIGLLERYKLLEPWLDQVRNTSYYRSLAISAKRIHGGDYMFFDGVVGHLSLAKQNICTVLAQKVASSECDIDLAKNIMQAVLHDNARRVFRL